MDANSALQYSDPAAAALNGSVSSVTAANRNLQSTLKQEDAAMQPSMEKFKQISSTTPPAPPTPKQAPPAPEASDFTKDGQAWVSAIAALSSLIGARGRARGTGALKAFAGGVKGLQAGEQQAFDNSYKSWKANSDAMFKENDEEMAKYKAVIDNRELSEAEAQQQMKMVGYEYQNKVMSDTHTADQAFAVYDSIVKARTSAESYVNKLEAKKAEMDKEEEQQLQKLKSDPSIGNLADAYHAGVPITTLVKGIGKDAQYKAQAIQDAATEKYGNFDWAENHNQYMARGSELRGIGTAAGKIELGGEMLDKSIPSMMDAARKVGLTESTDLNTLYNTAKRHLSDRDFSNFSTQLRATTSDYGVFIGRGRQTVHSDEEALKILHDNMGITSLQGFADAVSAERKNTSEAIGGLLGSAAGAKPSNTENVVHWDDLK